VRSFQYTRPESLEDLIALLQEYGPEAKLLAGGTDLLVRLRSGRGLPRIVIDLKRIEALRAGIVETGSGLRIGARTVMTDFIEDARARRHFPALVEAASVVGSIQIRNRATFTGNICNASPAADTAPALLVYGAVANLTGPAGRRSVALGEFFLGPGRTVLGRGEVVESIDLPYPSEPCGVSFGRLTRRRGVDLASVNLCCVVKASGEALLACGAVAPRPFVVRGPKECIVDAALAQARPISDVRNSADYRLAILGVIGRRCLALAGVRLQETMERAEAPCNR
jgi:carbon-monoxide dehydrogenase medium subunit